MQTPRQDRGSLPGRDPAPPGAPALRTPHARRHPPCGPPRPRPSPRCRQVPVLSRQDCPQPRGTAPRPHRPRPQAGWAPGCLSRPRHGTGEGRERGAGGPCRVQGTCHALRAHPPSSHSRPSPRSFPAGARGTRCRTPHTPQSKRPDGARRCPHSRGVRRPHGDAHLCHPVPLGGFRLQQSTCGTAPRGNTCSPSTAGGCPDTPPT